MRATFVYSFLFLLFPSCFPASQAKVESPVTKGEANASELKSKPIKYWQDHLSPEEVSVCRQGGTERAFSGQYHQFKEKGVFVCSSCGQELFNSEAKFDSGTGWPSFWEPVLSKNVELLEDGSLGMKRTEVKCSRCGAHLGHVFDDGPPPTGKRYCINSVCLRFSAKR